MFGVSAVFKEAQKMLDLLEKNKSANYRKEFEAVSDCGQVKVIATGDVRVKSISFDLKESFKDNCVSEELSQALVDTINHALTKAQRDTNEVIAQTMKPITDAVK